jgi:16S rRNA (uracil1498-N3)-methyltransferase
MAAKEELREPGGKVRLYVEAALSGDAAVSPDEAQAHYLIHVMRAKVGDRVSLFNGRDGEWLARIDQVKKRACTLVCERQTQLQSEVPDIWLCFAPIKKAPADYVVQKATELGVRVLQPVFTRRTIVSRVNLERMNANAIEAAEQSGRVSVPEVREPMDLQNLLAGGPRDRKLLFCDEAGATATLGGVPAIADGLRGNLASRWAILTGPEGGFDPAEAVLIRSLPFVIPVSLGKRILRADTAALAALAIWQALAGDWA